MERARPAIVAAAALAAGFLWVKTFKPHGDFLLHYEFGRRLRMGEFLYAGSMHIPYPPSWGMLFAPFSLLPVNLAMPLFFCIGIISLAALLWVLRDLTKGASAGGTFWMVTATLAVLSRFVVRDLQDGGENIFITALTWGGIYFFVKRKVVAGGALLGLAISLKCTPLLFAGYFLLKRQWLAALSTAAFSALFFFSPALVRETAWYAQNITTWKNNVVAGVSQKDPSVGVLGQDELANKSLRPMLARYLMQLPEGHPGRFGGKAYIDFFRLPPATANLIVKLVTLVSGLAIAWLFVRSPAGMAAPNFIWECAIINVLMLLFSPITWGEHCVSLIPAVYLICLRLRSGQPFAGWIKWATAAVAVVFIVENRSIIGFFLSELAESYHLITFCLIALTAIALAFWNEQRQAPVTT